MGRCLDCKALVGPKRVLCGTCIAKRGQDHEEEE